LDHHSSSLFIACGAWLDKIAALPSAAAPSAQDPGLGEKRKTSWVGGKHAHDSTDFGHRETFPRQHRQADWSWLLLELTYTVSSSLAAMEHYTVDYRSLLSATVDYRSLTSPARESSDHDRVADRWSLPQPRMREKDWTREKNQLPASACDQAKKTSLRL